MKKTRSTYYRIYGEELPFKKLQIPIVTKKDPLLFSELTSVF